MTKVLNLRPLLIIFAQSFEFMTNVPLPGLNLKLFKD